MKRIRVLIVEDSRLVQDILTRGLSQDLALEVVGVASDPYIAREMIAKHHPDVLTLDVEMPRMNGVRFLRHLMPQYPLPVIMISALTQKRAGITIEALEAGAIDFVTKPSRDSDVGIEELFDEICSKVKMAATVDVSHWKHPSAPKPPVKASTVTPGFRNKVIAIGASTGGVRSIQQVLARLPSNLPGIVIVQHMPSGFTKSYAERLNMQCAIEVKEARNGDRILPGRALIAPGDQHLTIRESKGQYSVICRTGAKVSGHCPSVDVLFQSVAQQVGKKAIGIIMTGMGRDGANGMLALRQAGGRTLAQDEKSCVVFGMPLEAYKLGGVENFVSLNTIPEKIISLLQKT